MDQACYVLEHGSYHCWVGLGVAFEGKLSDRSGTAWVEVDQDVVEEWQGQVLRGSQCSYSYQAQANSLAVGAAGHSHSRSDQADTLEMSWVVEAALVAAPPEAGLAEDAVVEEVALAGARGQVRPVPGLP